MDETPTAAAPGARAVSRRAGAGTLPALRQLEQLFTECTDGQPIPPDAQDRAQRRAQNLLETGSGARRTREAALRVYAGEVFAAVAVDLAARPASLPQLIEGLETLTQTPRAQLGLELLRTPQLLQLPTAVGIEIQLALLLALTASRSATLWAAGSDDELTRLGHTGKLDKSGRQVRRFAKRLLEEGSPRPEHSRDMAGVVVGRWQQPVAALIIVEAKTAASHQDSMLDAAVPLLSGMLEREDLRANDRGSIHDVLSAAERRLVRLRFDLHDGPQQDLLLLSEDLELFRTQLATVLDGHRHRDRLLGRLEDLQARLVVLDGDLRRISVAVESPFLHADPLPDALAQLTDDFATRTGIDPQTRIEGTFTTLTDSQQIALLGLIREALSNIREHSDATKVKITVIARTTGIQATVTDNGRGFDPEATLVRAAREGHLGLVGMHERLRLLGGRTRIDSRPGGPTVISITLPAVNLPPAP